MADISKITLPSGSTYNLKDAVARAGLSSLSSEVDSIKDIVGGAIVVCGKTSTALVDNATTSPITIAEATTIRGVDYAANASYDPQAGDAFFVTKTDDHGTHNLEYIWDGTHWHEFGDMTGIGELAYKNSASVDVTPVGGVSAVFEGGEMSSTVSYTAAGTVSLNEKSTTSEVAVTDAGSETATYTPSGSITGATISATTEGGSTTIKNPTAKTVVATATQGTLPSYTEPSYTAPSYTEPVYVAPSYTEPSYTAPQCTMPTYTAPQCTMPSCQLPTWSAEVQNEDLSILWGAGSYTDGSYTEGSYTDGSYTEGSYTSGSFDAGSYTSGSFDAGSYTSGSFDAGELPTFTSADSIDTTDVTVMSSETTYSSVAPTFSGNGVVIKYTDTTVSAATFTGATSSLTAVGTPIGNVNAVLTGNAETFVVDFS